MGSEEKESMKLRHGAFLLVLLIGTGVSTRSLLEIAALAGRVALYSHMPLVPIVSAYFLFLDRRGIFSEGTWAWMQGGIVLILASIIMVTGRVYGAELEQTDQLSVMMLGFVTWILGAFLCAYGVSAFKKASFPLFFLVFLIPVPSVILDPLVSFLQQASADASYLVFKLTGVPVHRQGLVFSLPGATVEVARQCSGIRSSIALFITSVVAGRLFLDRTLSRIAFSVAILPVTIFKNALRIVTLSLLGAYVDPAFLTGHWLHSSGGIPFFAVGLILLAPVLLALRRMERRGGRKAGTLRSESAGGLDLERSARGSRNWGH